MHTQLYNFEKKKQQHKMSQPIEIIDTDSSMSSNNKIRILFQAVPNIRAAYQMDSYQKIRKTFSLNHCVQRMAMSTVVDHILSVFIHWFLYLTKPSDNAMCFVVLSQKLRVLFQLQKKNKVPMCSLQSIAYSFARIQ